MRTLYIYIGSVGKPHPKAEAGQGCNSEKTVYNLYICIYMELFVWFTFCTDTCIYICMLKDI